MKRNILLLTALLSLRLLATDYTHYSEWITDSEMKRTPHPYNLNFSAWWPNWSYQTGIELDSLLCSPHPPAVMTSAGGKYPAPPKAS